MALDGRFQPYALDQRTGIAAWSSNAGNTHYTRDSSGVGLPIGLVSLACFGDGDKVGNRDAAGIDRKIGFELRAGRAFGFDHGIRHSDHARFALHSDRPSNGAAGLGAAPRFE